MKKLLKNTFAASAFIIGPFFLLTSCGSGQKPNVEASQGQKTPTSANSEQIIAANRALVDSCSARLPVNANIVTEVSVAETLTQACTESNSYSNPVKYRIQKMQDGLHLALKVNIKPDATGDSNSARWTQMVASTQQCVSTSEKIWKRYGVTLNLQLNANSSQQSDQEVTLSDEFGDSTFENLYFFGSDDPDSPFQHCLASCQDDSDTCMKQCEETRQTLFCDTFLFETGHWLGLADEFSDASCPARAFISQEKDPWSIMADPWEALESVQYFPRHLSTILEHACSAK